jgi:hypothetical protein
MQEQRQLPSSYLCLHSNPKQRQINRSRAKVVTGNTYTYTNMLVVSLISTNDLATTLGGHVSQIEATHESHH